jgi:hypothetical protein
MEADEILEKIRTERRDGELLGPLTDRYGAAAVVKALGVSHVAWSLGVREEVVVGEEGDDDA